MTEKRGVGGTITSVVLPSKNRQNKQQLRSRICYESYIFHENKQSPFSSLYLVIRYLYKNLRNGKQVVTRSNDSRQISENETHQKSIESDQKSLRKPKNHRYENGRNNESKHVKTK